MMFEPSLLTDFEVNVLVAAGGLACGMIFKTKLTDWFKGIPSELRTALNSVETDTAAKLKSAVASAEAAVFAKLPQPAAPKVALPAAAALAAPVILSATVAQAAPAAPVA